VDNKLAPKPALTWAGTWNHPGRLPRNHHGPSRQLRRLDGKTNLRHKLRAPLVIDKFKPPRAFVAWNPSLDRYRLGRRKIYFLFTRIQILPDLPLRRFPIPAREIAPPKHQDYLCCLRVAFGTASSGSWPGARTTVCFADRLGGQISEWKELGKFKSESYQIGHDHEGLFLLAAWPAQGKEGPGNIFKGSLVSRASTKKK